MVDTAFTLTANDIYSTLANMIISIVCEGVSSGGGDRLCDRAKQEVGLFGDRKIFEDVDILKVNDWLGDSEAANLLALDRAPAPKTQAYVVNKKKQIRLTTDEILSKQAFLDGNAFGQVINLLIGSINETKRVYEDKYYKARFGTDTASSTINTKTITLSGTNDGQTLAQELEDLMDDMSDGGREYNDHGVYRQYEPSELAMVVNSKYANKIKLVDTPTVYHRDGILEATKGEKMLSKYFGTRITTSNYSTYSAGTPAAGKPIDSDDGTYVPGSNHVNGCLRALEEQDITVSGTTYHVRPGDELPSGAVVYASSAVKIPCYIEDAKVIGKVYKVGKLPPFLWGITVDTSFFNARSLTTNRYCTFIFSEPEHLKGAPFITIKQA